MCLTLLNYRCTPIVDTGKSPIEVFIRRHVNCTILCMPHTNGCNQRHEDNVTDDRKSFSENDAVWFQKTPVSNWMKVFVVRKIDGAPRSYILKDQKGILYCRNMRGIVRRHPGLDRKANDDYDNGATVHDEQSWYSLRRRPQPKKYFELENWLPQPKKFGWNKA